MINEIDNINDIEVLPKEMIHVVEETVKKLEKQVQLGQNLLRNRPILKNQYDAWENCTADILKKSAKVEPTGSQRFACCLETANTRVTNEAFLENQRAMTVYDQISILEFHLNRLKQELTASKSPVMEH